MGMMMRHVYTREIIACLVAVLYPMFFLVLYPRLGVLAGDTILARVAAVLPDDDPLCFAFVLMYVPWAQMRANAILRQGTDARLCRDIAAAGYGSIHHLLWTFLRPMLRILSPVLTLVVLASGLMALIASNVFDDHHDYVMVYAFVGVVHGGGGVVAGILILSGLFYRIANTCSERSRGSGYAWAWAIAVLSAAVAAYCAVYGVVEDGMAWWWTPLFVGCFLVGPCGLLCASCYRALRKCR